MSISSQINDIVKDKAEVDNSSPFVKLFGQFGIAIAAIGILISLVYGIKVMEYKAWIGFIILILGWLPFWVVGMLMLGVAVMIDSTLRTEVYTRKMLEYTLTESGHEVKIMSTNPDPEYETPKEKLKPVLIEDNGTWMCPICGRYSKLDCRKCDCGYTVPDDFAPLQLDNGAWLCPVCNKYCSAESKSCSKCGYVIPSDSDTKDPKNTTQNN